MGAFLGAGALFFSTFLPASLSSFATNRQKWSKIDMEGRGEMALKVLARKARVLLLERCGHFLAPKMFVSNQHSVHLFHFISTKFISTPSLRYLKNLSTML